MTTDSGVADIEVKSNLFKDVKYYVAGTIEPEASKPSFKFLIIILINKCLINNNNNSMILDSKIAGKWRCYINKNYVHKHNTFIMWQGF